VSPGYVDDPGSAAKAQAGGWLSTGDLGYLVDGRLVVCGRSKDGIIVAGQNVYPQDIERAAGAVDGVRTGSVAAFGRPGSRGTEDVVVMAEHDPAKADGLVRRVQRRIAEQVGLTPGDVVLVEPGALRKTSSGKLQRAQCREDYLSSLR
jgi:fatty-acyl-CoA synthase